ncbi:hypothetical protein ACW4TU_10695 [Streptomyces sp. QTS52]
MASRTASPLVHPDPDDFDLFKVMSALTDETRLAIVVGLAASPGLACSVFRQDVTVLKEGAARVTPRADTDSA